MFACDAWLLRARLAEAKRFRDEAAALIAKHHYGRREPDLAVLDAEISPTLDTFRTACAQVGAEGWWHLMPRLESLVAAQPKGSWFRPDRHKPWDQLLAPFARRRRRITRNGTRICGKRRKGDPRSDKWGFWPERPR